MDWATIIQFFISGGGLIATIALFYKMGKFQGFVEEKFKGTDEKFKGIESEIKEIKTDIKEIKTDVRNIDKRLSRLEGQEEERFRNEIKLIAFRNRDVKEN